MIDTINSIVTTQEARYTHIDSDNTIEFLGALEYSLVKRTTLSVPFWVSKIGPELLNRIIYVLGNHNLIKTIVAKKYAAIEATDKLYNLVEDILDYRVNTKIRRYGMKLNKEDPAVDLVSTPSGIKSTGLVRRGFSYAAKCTFKLDIDTLLAHRTLIEENLFKSINKTILKYEDIALDEANYKELCSITLDNYITNPRNKYNLEANVSDQRGRAIYTGLKRIFNPVSSKDARALLIAPSVMVYSTDNNQMKDIYLFIAELVGSKAKTRGAKVFAGMVAYKKKRTLPSLEADELHKYMWLERIYNRLDKVLDKGKAKWDIPIEVDASMSLAQVEGALLNSQELLVKTNAVGDKLQDPWHIKSTRRAAAKAIGTPTFYGSNQTPIKLLKAKGLDVRKDELKALTSEFNTGTFSIIKDFKNLLISNMSIDTPIYEVQGWGETYTVEVNKYKAVGSTLDMYMIWNTETKRDSKFFLHTPTKVPDYGRFRSFAATGLVHNLDSKIMDNVMLKLKESKEWAIAIHDAVLCLPGTSTRKLYKEQLEQLNQDGLHVLTNYMKSIGATGTKANVELAKLLDKVTQNELEFSENALK